jgi:hypothetical protein
MPSHETFASSGFFDGRSIRGQRSGILHCGDRLADSPGARVAEMVMGAPQDERVDSIYAVWLIRGAGRNMLFESGFHRERGFKEWAIKDYLRPDEAVKLPAYCRRKLPIS